MSADDTNDELDDRIRTLLAEVVATAPDAPHLDVRGARDVRLVTVSAPSRGSFGALVGVAAVVSMIVGLWVVMSDGGPPAASPGTDAIVSPPDSTAVDPTYVSDPSQLEWPAGVAVVVASERGIERIAAPNGLPEVTSVYSGSPVSRAFELADGSYIFLPDDGRLTRMWPDVAAGAAVELAPDGSGTVASGADRFEVLDNGVVELDDAQLDPDGNLDLVYRTGTTGSGSTTPLIVWRPPAEPLVIELPGAWAVDYGRFDLLDDDIVASGWVDDTLQRGIAAFDATGMPVDRYDVFFGRAELGTRDVVGDVLGQLGVLSGSTFDVSSADLRPVDLPELAASGGDLDLQGATLAIDRPTSADQVVDLQTRELFDVPISDGVTTVSQREFRDPADVALDFGAPLVGNRLNDCMWIDTGSLADVEPIRGSIRLGVPTADTALDVTVVEGIEVSGRPATLTTFASGSATVELAPPYWCGVAWLTVDAVHRDAFVAWLESVEIDEQFPSGMPTFVVAGRRGVSVITASGTRVVSTEVAQRAVILGNGDVVYQKGASVFRWHHDTGRSEEMWAAVDFIAPPVLHDTYRGQLVYSVRDTVNVEGSRATAGISVEIGWAGRLSVSADGLVLGGPQPTTLSTGTALPDWISESSQGVWAISGASGSTTCCVAHYVSSSLTVADRAGGVRWRLDDTMSMGMSGIDVHDSWVAWAAFTPVAYEAWNTLGDDSIRIVDTSTGVQWTFSGVSWVSFAD